MFCGNCGVALPDAARFCNQCGKPVPAGPAGLKCPGCGEAIYSQGSPCLKCGSTPALHHDAGSSSNVPSIPRDPGEEQGVEHFEYSRRRARNENLIAIAVGLLLVPPLLYYVKDERDPWVLGMATVIAGGLAFATLAFTRYLKGTPLIDISPGGIRVRNRREDREMKWTEINHIRHLYLGGEWWHLTPVSGRKMSIPLDGFTDDQRKRIGELIQGYFQKSRTT